MTNHDQQCTLQLNLQEDGAPSAAAVMEVKAQKVLTLSLLTVLVGSIACDNCWQYATSLQVKMVSIIKAQHTVMVVFPIAMFPALHCDP